MQQHFNNHFSILHEVNKKKSNRKTKEPFQTTTKDAILFFFSSFEKYIVTLTVEENVACISCAESNDYMELYILSSYCIAFEKKSSYCIAIYDA